MSFSLILYIQVPYRRKKEEKFHALIQAMAFCFTPPDFKTAKAASLRL